MRQKHKTGRRKGAIIVLTAVMMVMMFALLAFSLDIGYLAIVHTEAQSAADSAALAATSELLRARTLTPTIGTSQILADASAIARSYVQMNPVGKVQAELFGSDLVLGRLNLGGTSSAMTFADASLYNAVQVRVRRTDEANSQVPMFFANVLGISSNATQAQATAAFIDNFSGFSTPSTGDTNLAFLPLALDVDTWNQLALGGCSDVWKWDDANNRILPGPDGIQEVNLYPQGTGSPGNRGTVDVGSSNNSTADIARQIRDGVSAEDLEHFDGKLALGPDGTLSLNGDTGISAGIKDDLSSIIGKTRIIPIFDRVAGNGNNAQYRIVKFVGIRVMEVKLTGPMSQKRVIVQPANITITGGIPGDDGTQTSSYIFSPVWLVR